MEEEGLLKTRVVFDIVRLGFRIWGLGFVIIIESKHSVRHGERGRS